MPFMDNMKTNTEDIEELKHMIVMFGELHYHDLTQKAKADYGKLLEMVTDD